MSTPSVISAAAAPCAIRLSLCHEHRAAFRITHLCCVKIKARFPGIRDAKDAAINYLRARCWSVKHFSMGFCDKCLEIGTFICRMCL